MKTEKTIYICTALLLLLSIDCMSNDANAQSRRQDAKQKITKPNTLTKQQADNGWKLLFNGKSMKGWREVWGQTFPNKDWVIKDGTLTVLASNGEQGGTGGSIITKDEYSNFELKADFKLTKGANSGIKYFVVENQRFSKRTPI